MDDIDILLVEDDPLDADLLRRVLTKRSPESKIFTAEDGEQALDLIFYCKTPKECTIRDLPNLIFLDLKLPKVDGFEVLKKLKGCQETNAIPIIVFSSSELEDDIDRAQQLGADLYIQKPMSFKGFESVVAKVADNGYF